MNHVALTRALFGSSLAFHIVFATIGVGLPMFISVAEILAYRRNDPYYSLMARRWAAVFAVFLGASVVSGTIVAVQLSLLWPVFMRLVGQIIALPFAIEVFAFFIEAVFTAIYVFAGSRISPLLRIFSSLMVAAGAAASALLITDVNAFMNTPAGFRVQDGLPVDIDPWRAMFNPAMPSELSHVLVTAYLAVALLLAAFPAWGLLRSATSQAAAYHRRELSLTLKVASVMALLTGVTGDWSGKFLAAVQPIKFAAAEALFETQKYAPLTLGGLPDPTAARTRFGLEIPGMLSWLATGRFDGLVRGLNSFPRSEWPPLYVHLLFDAMVAVGGAALLVTALYWLFVLRKGGRFPAWYLWTLVAMGPLAMVGIETGWVFAEIARQPWTVVGLLRTADAATGSPYVPLFFVLFLGLYVVLAIGATLAVRTHLRGHPLAADIAALHQPASGLVKEV